MRRPGPAGRQRTRHRLADLAGIATEVTTVELADFLPGAWAHALAPLLADEPAVVLPGSPDGRDLAPRAGRRCCTARSSPAPRPSARSGWSWRATAAASCTPARPARSSSPPCSRAFAASKPTQTWLRQRSTAVERHARRRATTPLVLAVHPPNPATVDLAEAPRIVGGGAGLDGPERIAQLAHVGAALGASMGATRVVTDRGWVAHERQIGTTGVVVDPELYLAFGVSGAVQHTSGLGNPAHIISVNTDQHCPMMQLADLAIVADANETLAALDALLTEGAA